MLVKNIVGTIILLLNAAGLGYLVFIGAQALIHHFFGPEAPQEDTLAAVPKKDSLVIDEDLIPDEADLLKDMDLSDLDNLNLDDFE